MFRISQDPYGEEGNQLIKLELEYVVFPDRAIRFHLLVASRICDSTKLAHKFKGKYKSGRMVGRVFS